MAIRSLRWADQKELDAMTIDECMETHPGFLIACRKCGSNRVVFENTLGFSEMSGGWGEATLTCLDCGESTTLIES